MVIIHASHHSWFKNISDDCLKNYGKSDMKKLIRTINEAPQSGVKVVFGKADHTFFEWFMPKHKEAISKKFNPLLLDVRGTTIEKPGKKSIYKTLTLWQKDKIVGGCIFSCWQERYSIAYRIYDRNWPHHTLAASPALYGEYLLDEYTRSRKKNTLTHGLDRNPYGINSSIGLAIFKLSVGCNAKLRHNHLEKIELDTDQITTDTLVLHYPKHDEIIKEATLICAKQNLERYTQLFIYEDRIKVNTLLK